MTPQSLLRIARSVYSSPCYLATFDDEGDVLVELRTIHGGPVLTVSAETHEQALIALVDLMAVPRKRTPQTSEQMVDLLQESIDRARALTTSKAFR